MALQSNHVLYVDKVYWLPLLIQNWRAYFWYLEVSKPFWKVRIDVVWWNHHILLDLTKKQNHSSGLKVCISSLFQAGFKGIGFSNSIMEVGSRKRNLFLGILCILPIKPILIRVGSGNETLFEVEVLCFVPEIKMPI